MFFEPQVTPYDLRFRIVDVDVRVSPWFWAMAGIFAWGQLDYGFQYWLVGIACIFISILIHEMGHIVVGRIFGAPGNIVLYAFGGLAVGSGDVRGRWARIAVALAGPCAQFLLLGLLAFFWPAWINELGVTLFRDELTEGQILQYRTLRVLWFINLYWPLLNLLPIWPLDGGRVSRELLSMVSFERGLSWSLGLSFACAAILAANAIFAYGGKSLIPYVGGGMWSIYLFGSLAIGSYQMMQQVNSAIDQGRFGHWERDDDSWRG